MEIFIIYIIGVVCSLVLSITFFIKNYNQITLSDFALIILTGVTSWIGVIVVSMTLGEDIIIYKSKEK